MEHQDIFDTIKREAADILDVDPELIVPEASWRDVLDADSVDIIELSGVLELTYQVMIEDKDLHRLVTVGDLMSLVASKR